MIVLPARSASEGKYLACASGWSIHFSSLGRRLALAGDGEPLLPLTACLVIDILQGKKTAKVFKPDEFHPHLQKKSAPALKVPVSILKQIFVKNRR